MKTALLGFIVGLFLTLQLVQDCHAVSADTASPDPKNTTPSPDPAGAGDHNHTVCKQGERGPGCMDIETKLFHDLFDAQDAHYAYNPHVRPIPTRGKAVNLTYGIEIVKIVGLNEKSKILTLETWISHSWDDPRLKWIPNDYKGLRSIEIPSSKIWLPDIVLYNTASDFTHKMESHVHLTHAGGIFWVPAATLQAYCEVNLSKFPFDVQNCRLVFGSWVHNGDRLDIQVPAWAEPIRSTATSEWDVKEASLTRNVKKYACCPEPYIEVVLNLRLKRKSAYPRAMLFYPGVLLAFTLCVVFVLPPGSQEKITLGAISLLTFLFLLASLQEFLPEDTPSLPGIGIYYCFSIFMTTLSMLLSACVLNMEHRGPRVGQMPHVLKTLLLGKLSTCLCVSQPYAPLSADEDAPRLEFSRDREMQAPSPGNSDRELLLDLLEEMRRLNRSSHGGSSVRHHIINEWRQGAQVLDRLFLALYFIVIVVASIIILSY